MPTSVREFLAAQKKEVLEKIQELKAELADIERAESALGPKAPGIIYRGDHLFESADLVENSPKIMARRQRIPGGIKLLVLNTLAANPDGLTALQMLDAWRDQNGATIARTSLSPQLSRLKDAGLVGAEHGVWSITDKGLQELA